MLKPHVPSVTSTSLASASFSNEALAGVDGCAVVAEGVDPGTDWVGEKVLAVGVAKGVIAGTKAEARFGHRNNGSCSIVSSVSRTRF